MGDKGKSLYVPKLYNAVAAQNVLPSYLSGSARMAPTNLPVHINLAISLLLLGSFRSSGSGSGVMYSQDMHDSKHTS